MTEHNNSAPVPDQEIPESEIDFEPEEELGDLGAAQAKLKKLKSELAKVKAERQEYLDGWQRCKADAVNAKREAALSSQRMAEMLREALVHDIIPVLDSFDMAASSEQWEVVDASWRGGMEHVRNQLITAIESHGVQRFGKIGELFDPLLYDAVQEVADVAGEQHSVVKILRYGYRVDDRILRPAQVLIKA